MLSWGSSRWDWVHTISIPQKGEESPCQVQKLSSHSSPSALSWVWQVSVVLAIGKAMVLSSQWCCSVVTRSAEAFSSWFPDQFFSCHHFGAEKTYWFLHQPQSLLWVPDPIAQKNNIFSASQKAGLDWWSCRCSGGVIGAVMIHDHSIWVPAIPAVSAWALSKVTAQTSGDPNHCRTLG